MTPCRAALALTLLALCAPLQAHDLSAQNAQFLEATAGAAPGAFAYLGAKHMFTGYDHLLYLLGILFFLHSMRDVILYVSLFTLGHSVTLLLGVGLGWQINAYVVDAVIGLSVVYKAFENIGGFEAVGLWRPDPRIAVILFGFCHGLGLATRLQRYTARSDGLWANLVSFNIGIELGQIAALALILLGLLAWRRSTHFERHAFALNTALMCAGFVLAGQQLAGYWFA